ncbi:MAG: hypothetical protein LUH36_10095 [Oscillospiraceae bacterium]|nr:hypothetical protein [Oscillospiraceae bacterium]
MKIAISVCFLILAGIEIYSRVTGGAFLISLASKKLRINAPEWGSRWADSIGMTFVVAFLAVGALGIVASINTARDTEAEMPPVTAENTPVNLFLQLDDSITLDEIMAQADDRDWDICVNNSVTSIELEAAQAVGADDVAVVYIAPNWSEDSDHDPINAYAYSLNQEVNCVLLTMDFATTEQGDSWLLWARLLIKTDDGTASCYYYPSEDYLDSGYDIGFTLKLKSRTYTLSTAQEVIDMAYPVVYPDGL